MVKAHIRAYCPSVNLALGTIIADPVHPLMTTTLDLIRIKTGNSVERIVKLQHHRVAGCSQGWMAGSCAVFLVPAPCCIAFRASRIEFNTAANACSPPVTAYMAYPTSCYAAPPCTVIWCDIIRSMIPLLGYMRCQSGQRVVRADGNTGTERTVTAYRSGLDNRFPLMRFAMWALVTLPPSLSVRLWRHHYAAKMTIFGVIPLPLQIWLRAADVWSLLGRWH